MIVNNGHGYPNYSQRNNAISPERACNVSAAISALASAGYQVEDGSTMQPEDRLMLFIRSSDECKVLWNQLDPKAKIPPEQWHAVLDMGINLWIGCHAVRMSESASAQMIMDHIERGGTGLVSGMFPTTQGHFVAVVGFQGDLGAPAPEYWIIKDPWGDYRTAYKNYYGNNIYMPYFVYIDIAKPVMAENKRFHFVRKA